MHHSQVSLHPARGSQESLDAPLPGRVCPAYGSQRFLDAPPPGNVCPACGSQMSLRATVILILIHSGKRCLCLRDFLIPPIGPLAQLDSWLVGCSSTARPPWPSPSAARLPWPMLLCGAAALADAPTQMTRLS